MEKLTNKNKDEILSYRTNPDGFEKVKKLLVDVHDFSEERIVKGIRKLVEEKEKQKQKGLTDFF